MLKGQNVHTRVWIQKHDNHLTCDLGFTCYQFTISTIEIQITNGQVVHESEQLEKYQFTNNIIVKPG
jgi:hypothetical protein